MNRKIARPWVGVVVAVTVAACGSSPSPSSSSTSLPSGAAPSAVTSAAPGAASLAPAADEEAIAYAISQRKTFGLRSDEAWVREVAADPRARTQLLDFPMLPEEEAEFDRRQTDFETIAGIVNAYAASHADEFGGVWIDQARHTVVAAWTRNPDLHRLAILAQLRSAGPLETKLVRYAERELNALTDRIFADKGWFSSIGAAPRSGGEDPMNNRIELQISSANPDAPALIRAHFGVGPDELAISSDGTGIALQPRGKLVITVVTADGKAPGRNTLEPSWTSDRPDGRECGEFVGYIIPPDGVLTVDCAPGGWTVTIQGRAGEGWLAVGSGHVAVPSGGKAELTITLQEGANLNP